MWYLNDKPIGNSIILGDRRIINPTREQYLAAGCVERGVASSEQQQAAIEHQQALELEFEQACQTFRQICQQIQTAADLESFKGGFDEMTTFQQSAVYSTIPGLQLAMAWNAANELCKYTGSKLGYGQPDWWYRCWEEAPIEPEENSEETTTD